MSRQYHSHQNKNDNQQTIQRKNSYVPCTLYSHSSDRCDRLQCREKISSEISCLYWLTDWHVQIASYKDYICQSCLQTRYHFLGLEQSVQTCNGFSSFHPFHIFPVLTNATRYLLGQKKVIVPLHSQNLSPLFLPGPWLFWLRVSFEVAATVSLQKR